MFDFGIDTTVQKGSNFFLFDFFIDFLNLFIESIKNFKGIIILIIGYYLFMWLFGQREIGYIHLRASLLTSNENSRFFEKGAKKLFLNNFFQIFVLTILILVYNSFDTSYPVDSDNIRLIIGSLILVPIIMFFVELFILNDLNHKCFLYIQSIIVYSAINSYNLISSENANIIIFL